MGAIEVAVPRELPLRADGVRIGDLSASSLELLYRCPERWRRRYIALERPPTSGAQHLGSCVDEAVAAHFRARLEGRAPSEADALDVFRTRWAGRLRAEPVVFSDDDPAGALLDRGASALLLYLRQAAPQVEPEAVQRRVEFRLGPELGWSVIGYPDLETTGGDLVDLKVKARHLGQAEADASLQATLYLLARRLEVFSPS